MSIQGHEHEHEHGHGHGPPPERPRILARALLSAGERAPQVSVVVPGAAHALRLSPQEAKELSGRLLAASYMARHDAAVYAALAVVEEAALGRMMAL